MDGASMDDSIVDIDEALGDSFNETADESFDDVSAIVQQWKVSSDNFSPSSDDKFLNTRTFTRPKRRVFPKITSGALFANPLQQQQPNNSPPSANGVHLKIGGLVTSPAHHQALSGSVSGTPMQRSFLGDISPPSSMLCSTSFTSTSSVLEQHMQQLQQPSAFNQRLQQPHLMAGSLVTSSDFSDINYFADERRPSDDDALAYEATRPPVFDDISALNAAYAEDDDALEVDDTFVQMTARVQLADSLTESLPPNGPADGDADDTEVPLSPASAMDESLAPLNATYDNETLTNRTLIVMDAPQPLNVTVDTAPSVPLLAAVPPALNSTCTFAGDDGEAADSSGIWKQPLNGTFQLDDVHLGSEDATFEMDERRAEDPTQLQRMDDGPQACSERDYDLQSTPIKAPASMQKIHALLNESAASIVNISPIAADAATEQHRPDNANARNKFHTYVRPKVRPSVIDLHQAPQPPPEVVVADADLDDDVLRSPREFDALADERQSLQNFEEFEKSLSLCKNDKDFDAMLNGLDEKSQHLRSSDAQMRQSLDHIKKRHSLLNLEKQLEDQQRRSAAAIAAADSNRLLSQSTASNRSMTGSGSGDRLLRRSRVMDEFATSTRMDNSSGSCSSTASLLSDSKENVQCNFDSNREPADVEPTGEKPEANVQQPTTAMLKPRIIPANRDRFKTIRISKLPPERDDDQQQAYDAPAVPFESSEPESTGEEYSGPVGRVAKAPPAVHSGLMLPGRMSRPSQLPASGLSMRRDASLSNAIRPSATNVGEQRSFGLKAKSIQNLVGRSSSVEKSADETNARSQKELSDPVFKMPSALPGPRARSIARPSGLARPSSGYFGFSGPKRNDSDTESGRQSPTNSLSSASSKGSLYRADTDSASTASTDDVRRIDAPVPPASQADVPAQRAPPPSRLQTPRRSGLQPPTATGAFAAAAHRKRSGLPRPMSMANR